MLSEQMQKNWEEIQILSRIDPEKVEKEVCFGALVITGKQKLFISTGVGKFEMDGETWFAISPSVPIYLAMAGLKKGDSFEFRNEKISILDVF